MGLTTTQQMQLKFWQGFSNHVVRHGKLIKPTIVPKPRYWMGLGSSIGRPGFFLYVVASTWSDVFAHHELRTHLSLKRGKEPGARLYKQLQSQKRKG